MSETPVLLTAAMSDRIEDILISEGWDRTVEDRQNLAALSAIATEATVCIEAERLARMEAALRRFVSMEDGPVYVAAPDIAAIAREALTAQEVGNG